MWGCWSLLSPLSPCLAISGELHLPVLLLCRAPPGVCGGETILRPVSATLPHPPPSGLGRSSLSSLVFQPFEVSLLRTQPLSVCPPVSLNSNVIKKKNQFEYQFKHCNVFCSLEN